MYRLILKYAPNFVHNLCITLFNVIQYNKRYGKMYGTYKKDLGESLNYNELRSFQQRELVDFIKYAYTNSSFYKSIYSKEVVASFKGLDDLKKLPILNKELLRQEIHKVYTIKKKKAIISKTGGTTGKPLEVRYARKDIQKRFAFLDLFREELGYKLGEKTAWFSGKNILNQTNVKRNIFWKYDFFYKVKYYSTFHCSGGNLKYMLSDLEKFNPKYLVGFPSNLFDIATYGLNNNIKYKGSINAIFPTAETITPKIKTVIETFFNTKLYNQYASSEGAPFITECLKGCLHLELRSGVFEVLNSKNEPASDKGKLVVTSFSTHGTPLIRYDIGDEIEFFNSSVKCTCGNENPIIKNINGRISDFIYSPFTGKINLGNISNATKGVKGIIRFQIIQNYLEEVDVCIEKDQNVYNNKYEKVFLSNLYDRFGEQMRINLIYVLEINKEKSGKFRLIKNNISDKLPQ